MAFSVQSTRRAAMSEINVTPLVDVMLVLLIIFMVTAPMMQEGVTVDLPETEDAATLEQEAVKEQIIISVSGPGNIYVNEVPVAEKELVGHMQSKAGGRAPKEVYLRADKTVPYASVVRIIGMLKAAGITHLGLITTKPEEPKAGK